MKRTFKKIIAGIAFRLGLWRPIYGLYHLLTGKYILVAFSYHRIVDCTQTENFYTFYDRGLDAAIFERHIECIQAYFDVISLDEFIEIVTGRKELQRHSALITFDDADSDYIDYAIPIIRARNLDAVVLAPTGPVESGERLWHVRISNILRRATPEHWREIQRQAARLPGNIREIILHSGIESEEARGNACRAVNLGMDNVDHDTIHETIELWERIVGGEDILDIKCMTWEQLRMLEENRSVIESHTVSHRKLTMLPEDEIREELQASKRQLEEKLDKTVKAVSYPQGRCTDRICELAREAGYRVGFTTRGGICDHPLEGLRLFRIPRPGLVGDTRSDLHFNLGKLALMNLLRN